MNGVFCDRHGREFHLTLTVADLRPLARLGFDVAKLATGEEGAEEALYGSTDALAKAVHRLSGTDLGLAEIADGIDGEVIEDAGSAVLEALADFFPPLPPREDGDDEPDPDEAPEPPTADALWRTCLELGGICGLDPDRRTMRELWFLACGAWDKEVQTRAFWMNALGGKVTAEALADMHPIRRLEVKPKSEAARRAESDLAFRMMGAALSQLNEHRRK